MMKSQPSELTIKEMVSRGNSGELGRDIHHRNR